MELSKRKRAVLAAVIKAYIETGEPVGSKALTGLIENAPSSATLRNEMSELCELGLLHQPHTSAGRVPTSGGLRLYVENLMSPEKIPQSAKSFIDAGFENIHCDPEKIPALAGKIISDLTGLPAITCFLTDTSPRVRKIELMPISRSTVMLLLISSDGRARNRIFRLGRGFTPELIAKFKEIVKSKIDGKTSAELTRAYMQSVTAASGADSLKLLPLLSAVFEMAEGIEASSVDLSGEACLYDVCDNEEAARKIRMLIDRRDPILSIIDSIDGSVGVIFGNDTGYGELKSDTIIAAKYSGADNYKGAIGVIGPNRISYEQIIPSVEYIANKLTEVMTQAQKDMED